MTRLIIPALVALVIAGTAGSGYAVDKDGNYSTADPISCGDYLDAYSKATLTGKSEYKGPHGTWKAFARISGYLTAYNRYVPNGKANIIGSMSLNNGRKWIASWCRDNPSKDLEDGIVSLISKLEK